MLYTYQEANKFLLNSITVNNNLIRDNNNYYYNIAMSFDIETTSFYYNNKTGAVITNQQQEMNENANAEKRACMYIWQFAINDNVVYGRTWSEFIDFCKRLQKYLKLFNNKYCIIYVHNLAYEFQFMSKLFRWVDVFADAERKPFFAINTYNMIFKCSYRLSGYSLDMLAKTAKIDISKKVGNLDYSLLRNSKTVLSTAELDYCISDVLIVTHYINTQIKEYDNNICRIPLTQTGKVRRFLRKKCFENREYHYLMDKLTIDFDEYQLLKNAFAGGFTHANAMYIENECHNVTSYDITSSYPTVLISEQYPMSKGRRVYIENETMYENIIRRYASIVDIKLYNVVSTFMYDNIISLSKCRNVKNVRINNGRVISADCLTVSITDIDYINIKKFYKYDKIEFGLCYIYDRGYLPKEIVISILELYRDKTELKGVTGKELEYTHAKELLNSIYGMCVTSIVHDNYQYKNTNWSTTTANTYTELQNYNIDYNRFLFYPWGVWCTAYARNNLFTALKECQSDYIYSDTDSVKIVNAQNHTAYFERYNNWIKQKIALCLQHYNIDISYACPSTIDGVIKPLGIWDIDGKYTDFKTLGAKRYMSKDSDNNYSITVCGLAKASGKDYITQHKNPFDVFNCGMYVDREHTGKMIHTYIDNAISGYLVDYQGNKAYYEEKSYIHLENADFNLSISKMYLDYFLGLQKLY